MESFRLVCRDARGEWYMHDAEAENAVAAFEAAAAGGLSPHVVVPERLGRGVESAVVQRWKSGATNGGKCLNCEYDLRGLVRAADSLAVCPECGVGAVMKPVAVEPVVPVMAAQPGFVPGATVESWALTFSVIGFVFFPAAMLGVALGAVAYEFTRGVRGMWAIRIGTVAMVIHGVLFALRMVGIRF